MIVAGILAPLEHALRAVLDWLGPHGTIGLPWGWSIVALTILVRVVLVPLTVKQIHSMQALQAHAPQMKEIQRKYKGDRQRQNEELMKFYKENNINPAASCLPMLAQIPVFWLGLVDITHHASTGWGPLLILIYASSQVASSYFMSATVDKSQRIMFMVLPIAFIPFIIRFQAGLVLYWVTTNLWTVGQGLITRRLVPQKGVALPKRSSRTPPMAATEDGAARKAPEPKAAPAAAPRRVKRKKRARR